MYRDVGTHETESWYITIEQPIIAYASVPKFFRRTPSGVPSPWERSIVSSCKTLRMTGLQISFTKLLKISYKTTSHP